MERKLTSPRSAGFTLIELLVAVAVMAVITLGAVLAASRGQVEEMAPDMVSFTERFALAQALAIEGRRTGGLEVGPEETQFFWRVGANWVPQADPVPWRGRVRFDGPPGAAWQERPDILFLPNGQTTPFTMSFASGQCGNDGWTGLRCSDG